MSLVVRRSGDLTGTIGAGRDALMVQLDAGVVGALNVDDRPIFNEREAMQLRCGADRSPLSEPFAPGLFTRHDQSRVEEAHCAALADLEGLVEAALRIAHMARLRDLHLLEERLRLHRSPLMDEEDRGLTIEQPIVS